jgi:hypothetical protein
MMAIDDQRPWQALLRAARRANVGLRMAMLDTIDYRDAGERQRKRRLAFLAAFLDDGSVREVKWDSKRYEGAWSTFPRLEVRDLAAIKIGSILDLEFDPQPDWRPEQWGEFRSRVRRALCR